MRRQLSSRRGRGNVGIPKGFPKSVGRVGSRLLGFHAFHTLSFPWPAFRRRAAEFTAKSTSAMGRPRKEVFVVMVVDECIGDLARIEKAVTSRLAAIAATFVT
jgi:hypothetical protein